MSNQYEDQVISPGDRASQVAARVCVESYGNAPSIEVLTGQEGHFRGMTGFRWKPYVLDAMKTGNYTLAVPGDRTWELLEIIQNDGAGGKLAFHALVGTPEAFLGAAWEPIVMCVDDIARFGGLPAVMSNEIQTQRITEQNFPLFKAAMQGLKIALKQIHLTCITGETAIMRPSITAFCDQQSDEQLLLTWGASCTGLLHHKTHINGSTIRPGMPIVGFWEPGYRCNGGTFFVNLLLALANRCVDTTGLTGQARHQAHLQWMMEQSHLMRFVCGLTTPSLCYAPTLTRIMGWDLGGVTGDPLAKIHGAAHITGGGVWGKLVELLPDGIGANLNQMPQPAQVLLTAQDLSWDVPGLRLTDHQAYGTLHGGCGMLLVVELGDQQRVIDEAAADGVKAQVVGMTTSSRAKEIVIHSRFREKRVLRQSLDD